MAEIAPQRGQAHAGSIETAIHRQHLPRAIKNGRADTADPLKVLVQIERIALFPHALAVLPELFPVGDGKISGTGGGTNATIIPAAGTAADIGIAHSQICTVGGGAGGAAYIGTA